MRTWILITLMLAPMAAQADTVFLLEKGSIRRVHGTVIREVPGESVTIQTPDGTVLVFALQDIVNVVREDTSPIAQGLTPTTLQGPRTRRDPAVAMLLSFLIPGAGQFYNGEVGKGALQLGGTAVGLALFIANFPRPAISGYSLVSEGNATLSNAGIALSLTCSLWSLIDAPTSANKINRRNGLALRPTWDASQVGLAARLSF